MLFVGRDGSGSDSFAMGIQGKSMSMAVARYYYRWAVLATSCRDGKLL